MSKIKVVLRKIKFKYIFSLIVFFNFGKSAYSQNTVYEKEAIRVAYIKKNIGKGLTEVKSKKVIRIFIYQSFNDTLLFKLGNKIVGKYMLNTDTINSSSDFSGTIVNIKIENRKNNISIYLLKEKKYVSFNLIHKRRFYTLHRSVYTENGKSHNKWNLNGCYKWF